MAHLLLLLFPLAVAGFGGIEWPVSLHPLFIGSLWFLPLSSCFSCLVSVMLASVRVERKLLEGIRGGRGPFPSSG